MTKTRTNHTKKPTMRKPNTIDTIKLRCRQQNIENNTLASNSNKKNKNKQNKQKEKKDQKLQIADQYIYTQMRVSYAPINQG